MSTRKQRSIRSPGGAKKRTTATQSRKGADRAWQRPPTRRSGTRVKSNAEGVLIVDDDPSMRGVLAELLIGRGIPVVQAHDGAVALALLRKGLRPALILLDLMMPGMDGRAFRREQSRHPALRKIPTIVMTGSAIDTEALGRELGGVPVMAKPIDYDRLLALVSRHCAIAA